MRRGDDQSHGRDQRQRHEQKARPAHDPSP
jgi:hypothetical protein